MAWELRIVSTGPTRDLWLVWKTFRTKAEALAERDRLLRVWARSRTKSIHTIKSKDNFRVIRIGQYTNKLGQQWLRAKK